MSGGVVVQRAATFDDVPALAELERAADISWWGRSDVGDDDVRHILELAGDLGSRTLVLVEAAGGIVGSAAVLMRGDGVLPVAPVLDAAARDGAGGVLLRWLIGAGAQTVDAPRHDAERLALLQQHGFAPERSSFELALRRVSSRPRRRGPPVSRSGRSTWSATPPSCTR